jgi:hypothetical protein
MDRFNLYIYCIYAGDLHDNDVEFFRNLLFRAKFQVGFYIQLKKVYISKGFA